MAIITLWNGTEEQCGTTSSSIALATQIAIDHNVRVLLISTSFNDSLIKDSFWVEKKKSALSVFTDNRTAIVNSGVEGLDRIIRSNKISPEIIKDYTQVVLTNRLEVLMGIEGAQGQYDLMKERYSQIISLAGKAYDVVIVDLDNKIGTQATVDIIKESNVIVAMVSQRAKQIAKIDALVKKNQMLPSQKTVITIGKYMENTKYNAKNISRNILRTRDIVNTVPYNSLFFEASQEGKVIDLFLNLMKIREKDENYFFVEELKRLYETIRMKLSLIRMIK